MSRTIKKKEIRHHKFYGISLLSVIPVRATPSDKGEIVTQILFGETFQLLDKRGQNWVCIKCSWDGYVGWIDEKMMTYIEENDYYQYSGHQPQCVEMSSMVNTSENSFPILMGSTLPNFDGISSHIIHEKYIYTGQVANGILLSNKADFLEKFVLKYLKTPYLWGGRSPFGIDCSGLVQVVYRMIGISLPRDASQQVHEGVVIDFITLAQKGDLAFFDNEDGQIIHVGILLNNEKIIHASGEVRIDHIDHYGIYQINRRKYSHKLRMIKRVID